MSVLSAGEAFMLASGEDGVYQISKSLRFNAADSSNLSKTFSGSSSTTFTLSYWIKRSKLGAWQYMWSQSDGSSICGVAWSSNDRISLYNGGHNYTTAFFRDVSAWYHICLKVSSGSATLYVNNAQVATASNFFLGASTAQIGMFVGGGSYGDNSYIADFQAIDGQALDPTDFAEYDDNNVWVAKEFTGSYGTNGFRLNFADNSSNAALGNDAAGSNNWTVNNLSVAGPSVTTTGNISLGSSNRSFYFKGSVGDELTVASGNFVWDSSDGNTWTYRGQSGTTVTLTSAYVEISGTTSVSFTNASSDTVVYWSLPLGTGLPNSSGTTDTFNIDSYGEDAIDSLIDTPMNITADSGNNPGNHATLNPLHNGGLTLSNGNLDVAKGAGGWATTTGTIGISSGKYYFEYTASTAYDNHMIGVVTSDVTLSTYLGNYASGWGYQSNGNKVHADSFTGSQPTANSGGDIIQVAVDMDAGKIWFGINGTYIGSGNPSSGANPAYSNLSGTVFPAVSHAGTLNGSFNFGARDFSYTPPTNFVSICTTNLPDPTIADGSTAFDTKLWAGNSGSQTISGLGFSPDLVWGKCRSNGGTSHHLTDAVRGANKSVFSNGSNAEATYTNYLTAFTSDGFTLGNGSELNYSGRTFVGWAWDAGETRHYAGEVSGSFNAGSGADKIFDGLITTQANGAGAASSTFTWTLVSPITVNTSLEVYLIDGKSKFTVNGGTQTSPLNNSSWQDLGFTGSLSSLQVQGDTGVNTAPRLAAIRIDGTIITDPALVSAGSLNSSVYVQSQTWSNQVSGTQNSSYPFSNVFNADNMATHAYPANGTEAVFTPSPSFSSATTVTIWYYAPTLHANAFKLNGTGVGNSLSTTAGTNTHTFDVTGTGFTSLSWSKGVYGSEDTGLLRIDVDGVQLVDNGVSVANVPSIASTVRANPSTGFSIVTYTGTGASASVSHGLNSAPGFIIIKRRDSTVDWVNYHSALGVDKYVQLNLTSAATTSSGYWGTVNSNTFGLPSFSTPNASGGTFVAYCFAPVAGYSAFGSYTGNGSADGPFVYTGSGFKPAFILIKGSSFTSNWFIQDNERDGYNVNDGVALRPNLANAEDGTTSYNLDILSNGFKLRTSAADSNTNGETFVWAAFAEHPFKTARAR